MNNPRVQEHSPSSVGGVEAAAQQGQMNVRQKGNPAFDTADFSDRSVGNLRVDYCLPSTDLRIVGSGVFWPESSDSHAKLLQCSDHRLVWVDLHFGE